MLDCKPFLSPRETERHNPMGRNANVACFVSRQGSLWLCVQDLGVRRGIGFDSVFIVCCSGSQFLMTTWKEKPAVSCFVPSHFRDRERKITSAFPAPTAPFPSYTASLFPQIELQFGTFWNTVNKREKGLNRKKTSDR